MFRSVLVLLFLSSIIAANYAVSAFDPVSVGFGIVAPAGVYLVALTLTLRDLVQRFSGPWGVACAGVGGVLLSFILADSQVVWASVGAFAVSFLIDTAVYTLLARRGHPMWRLILISGLISLVPDTLIFCSLAGLQAFIPGQLLGKLYGTVSYAVYWWLLDLIDSREAQRSASVPSE